MCTSKGPQVPFVEQKDSVQAELAAYIKSDYVVDGPHNMYVPMHKKFWNYYSEYKAVVPEKDGFAVAFEGNK